MSSTDEPRHGRGKRIESPDEAALTLRAKSRDSGVGDAPVIIARGAVVAGTIKGMTNVGRTLDDSETGNPALVAVCAVCRSTRMAGEWYTSGAETFSFRDTLVTHTVCPPCARQKYGDLADD